MALGFITPQAKRCHFSSYVFWSTSCSLEKPPCPVCSLTTPLAALLCLPSLNSITFLPSHQRRYFSRSLAGSLCSHSSGIQREGQVRAWDELGGELGGLTGWGGAPGNHSLASFTPFGHQMQKNACHLDHLEPNQIPGRGGIPAVS